jgi:hypothetical protein
MNDDTSSKSTFDAWAHGCDMPAASGYSGTSASGWDIRRPGEEVIYHRQAIPSTTSNRRAWEARIMAVKGVLENLPRRSAVRVRVNDQTFADAVNIGFVKTSGEAMAGKEFWVPTKALLIEKHINLVVVLAEKQDKIMKWLIEDVRNAARIRLAQLGEDKALADAVAPRKSRSPKAFRLRRLKVKL